MDQRLSERAPAAAGVEDDYGYGPDLETISRDEFVEEFIDRYEPGQHAVFLGPTGRGKTLLMRDLVEAGPPIRNIGVLLPKGRNKTLEGFGMTLRNTDEGTQERLGEILSMPHRDMEYTMRDMQYHDFLWRDNIQDETFYVRGARRT